MMAHDNWLRSDSHEISDPAPHLLGSASPANGLNSRCGAGADLAAGAAASGLEPFAFCEGASASLSEPL
jgi:hypothetical protein